MEGIDLASHWRKEYHNLEEKYKKLLEENKNLKKQLDSKTTLASFCSMSYAQRKVFEKK